MYVCLLDVNQDVSSRLPLPSPTVMLSFHHLTLGSGTIHPIKLYLLKIVLVMVFYHKKKKEEYTQTNSQNHPGGWEANCKQYHA